MSMDAGIAAAAVAAIAAWVRSLIHLELWFAT